MSAAKKTHRIEYSKLNARGEMVKHSREMSRGRVDKFVDGLMACGEVDHPSISVTEIEVAS
jgi:hypothetical protein